MTHFNAQGLQTKFNTLKDFIADTEYDIIAISETWLDKEVMSSEFTPEGYITYRKDRNIKDYTEGTYVQSDRGGVLIMLKGELNPHDIVDDIEAEMLWLSITPYKDTTLRIGVVYRPDKGRQHNLDIICESIQNINTENAILVGDFNFPDINWDNYTASKVLSQQFLDTIDDNGLTQTVHQPTRGKNILDLVLCGNSDIVDQSSVNENFGTSDHMRTDVDIRLPVPRIYYAPRKVYLYSKADYEGFNSEVNAIKWETTLNHQNIESKWLVFKNIYSNLCDKYIPFKLIKPGQRHKPGWCNYKSVKKAKKVRRKAWVNYKKSGLEADSLIHQEKVKAYKETILNAQSDYEDSLVNKLKTDAKPFYNYCRHFMRSSSTIDSIRHNNDIITDDQSDPNKKAP